MSSKYLTKANFWVLSIDNNYSGTMNTILRHCDLDVTIMNRVIIDGENTDLWYDPRINHKSVFNLLG